MRFKIDENLPTELLAELRGAGNTVRPGSDEA
jgi:hypothetical protein